MKSMIDNYVNGNLKDAKRQAKRFPHNAIAIALFNDYGHSWAKACATAAYLKGDGDFQTACDTP